MELSKRDLVLVTNDKDYEWPTESDIRREKQNYLSGKSEQKALREGIWIIPERIWIPDGASKRQLHKISTESCGEAGHSGKDSTKNRVSEL